MNIGIIGAGGIGQALAGHVARAGYETILSNSRDPASLAEVVSQLGARTRAGTRQQAALADIVVVAVRWAQLRAALAELPAWNGRILIDATNPIIEPGFRIAELNGSTSSEVTASLAPQARVVKVANTLPRALLASDPNQFGGHRVLFMSGDDAAAKADVRRVLETVGFAVIDLGDLASGGKMQQVPSGPVATLNLIKLG
jgi:predicted dinucleotide-binding enzyme